MLYPLNWLTSCLATGLRLGAGRSGPHQAAPETGLPTLYEFEGCPYCKIAREAISHVGMSVLVRPCPKGGKRFRPEVKALGSKAQFPYIVDITPGISMYESGNIARAVSKQAGRPRPLVHALGPINAILAQYAILLRFLSGTWAKASTPQDRPLEFFGAENHPGARLVKEQLCALELEYIWHPGGAEGVELTDPNSGQKLTGTHAALTYLKTTYKA